MKLVDVTSDSYAEYNEDSIEKDPKFNVSDRVTISKYKNIFAEGYTQHWSEEVFIIINIENTVLWKYAINDLNGEPIVGSFYEKDVDLSNHATKYDLKNVTRVDTSSFAL